MSKTKLSVLVAGAMAALAAAAVDQQSKAFIFAMLSQGDRLPLAPMVSVSPGLNAGTAFGLASGAGPWPLILVALLVSAWLLALLVRGRSLIEGGALGAVIGGALANVADRIRFGAVRDFIDVHWNSNHWPTFNMADAFIVGGLLLFVLLEHLQGGRDRPITPQRHEV